MSITDLTGYTWYGNDNPLGPTSPPSQITCYITFNSNNTTYTSLTINHPNDFLNYDNTRVYSYPNWINQNYRTIEITGGTDVTNSSLISWLENNGTFRPSSYTITIDETGYVVENIDLLLINLIGLYNSTAKSQLWSYSGTGKFLGFNTSSGQSTPSSNYEINDTFTASSDLTLYSVEKLPTVTYDLSNLDLSPGTYTITAKAKGEGYLDSVASNSVTYTVIPPIPETCLVQGLGSENISNVTFTKTSGFTLQGLGIEEVTKGTDIFIKIPTMYRKVNTVVDNQITSFTISNIKIDNTYQPYCCFLKEDGITIMPYILIGKYLNTSTTSCISTSENTVRTVTLSTGRSRAQRRGTGYQLFDWQMQKLWQDLIICFKETINTNSGSGIGINNYDELNIYWHTGTLWIDGVISGGGTWRFSYKPSEYVSLSNISDTIPSTYNSASYTEPTSGGLIQKLGYDINNQFFNYINSSTPSEPSYDTYYCDTFAYSSSNRPVESGVSVHENSYGIFNCGASLSWSSTFSTRLCYRPINE